MTHQEQVVCLLIWTSSCLILGNDLMQLVSSLLNGVFFPNRKHTRHDPCHPFLHIKQSSHCINQIIIFLQLGHQLRRWQEFSLFTMLIHFTLVFANANLYRLICHERVQIENLLHVPRQQRLHLSDLLAQVLQSQSRLVMTVTEMTLGEVRSGMLLSII